MRERLRSLVLWSAGTFPVRCARRFRLIDGQNRSMVLAGQAFTTIIPLLIITASATGRSDAQAVGDNLVARFHLSGDSAQALRTLFLRPPDSTGAMSVVGLVVLLASLLSLTRSLQRVYEAAWGLPPRGLPGAIHGLGGMSLLLAQVIILTLLASALRGAPASSVLTAAARLMVSLPLWWFLQYLLLSRRIPARRLLPGAAVLAVGQLVVMLVSAYWMPRVIAGDAAQYGLIGVTFALISWLIIVALAIVVGAAVSAELVSGGTGRNVEATAEPGPRPLLAAGTSPASG